MRITSSAPTVAITNQTSTLVAGTTVGSAVPPTALLPTVMALAVVVLAILVIGSLLKRFWPRHAAARGRFTMVAQLQLGAKERLVMVDCSGETLLLGVTAQQITLLSTHPSVPLSTTQDDAARPTPAALIARWLGKTPQADGT